jgi:DNA-binding CsgD family transcriptional regulator
MGGQRAATELRGRSDERSALDRLLDEARAGQSAVLVIRGEPGVGKSALLEYTAERASGFRIARARGVESEMEFAFAGLQQLCGGSSLARADQLAAPQRDALFRAYGLMDGPPPERFLVGLALLNLLTNLAEDQPLVCLLDDVQWLDRGSASVLSFVARRLSAEPIAVVFSVREPSAEHELEGLPELLLDGLAPADARALLDAAVPGGLDEQVRERILAETRGNPLALLELPHGLTPAELAGGFGLLDSRELSSRIEQSFLRRMQALPPETQRLLLVAAAEDVGDAAVVSRAAARLGVQAGAVVPAEDAGLIEGGPRFRFRHPLVRAASYRAATPHERRQVHEALAAATDPEHDPDRRAWHRAQAASGPDEAVAAELERSAARACARGGVAAGAAFLEHAAELTPDPAPRGARAVAAARLKIQVGAPDASERLLAIATATPLNELDLARVDRMRALMVFIRNTSDAAPLLSAAATRMEPHDPELARDMHLEAIWAGVRSGRFANAKAVVDAAAAAVSAGREPTRAIDLLLAATVARMTKGYEPALPTVARALAALRAEGFGRENLASDELLGPRCWLACQLAMDLWDDAAGDEIATGLSRFAREQGRLTILPFALNYSAVYRLFLGELGIAEQLQREAEAITAATRGVYVASVSGLLAAWRGERERTEALRTASIETGTARGDWFAVEFAELAAAVLHNGLGDYVEAAAAARRGYDPNGLGFSVWLLPELVEAAVRSGDRTAAEDAFEQLVERSRTSTTGWAQGVEAAARALLSHGPEAEQHYLLAMEQLGRSRVRVLHTRAQLTYGEWLRREGRRVDARTQLKAALAAFEAIGAEGFADRARRELLATGETVRKRTDDTRGDLTPQEAQIARLASERLSNPEIAGQLYLSPRTVEYHLRKVFQKLGISSRRELAHALPGARPELIPT